MFGSFLRCSSHIAYQDISRVESWEWERLESPKTHPEIWQTRDFQCVIPSLYHLESRWRISAQLPCIGLSWPLTNPPKLGVELFHPFTTVYIMVSKSLPRRKISPSLRKALCVCSVSPRCHHRTWGCFFFQHIDHIVSGKNLRCIRVYKGFSILLVPSYVGMN